ncbi:hypothetical protein [Burkholderia anthina]|uniref:hypothetical protein n=1 Tax=Burkholderia anthina TaxID=179879 RepID=UPI00158E0DB3|nr:hypothetical protein [Burkholderia anthina]
MKSALRHRARAVGSRGTRAARIAAQAPFAGFSLVTLSGSVLDYTGVDALFSHGASLDGRVPARGGWPDWVALLHETPVGA